MAKTDKVDFRMPASLCRVIPAALFAVALTGALSPAFGAASPDFYGIKMNSENHARDLSPDELSLFPVRRGFDKNVYAYGHLDATFNHTRSITFHIFNNTDNDLFTEKSFREYYVVLRNGERYRLNEPGMSLTVDRIDARTSAKMKADFGSLNVTREEIEMVVCSFDMGKVKIVLLPIAEEPPAPLSKEEATRLIARKETEPAPVIAKDQAQPRLGPDGPVVKTPKKFASFPLMDWPVFSWMKGTSADPERPKPALEKKAESPAKTNFSAKETTLKPLVLLAPVGETTPAKKPSKGLFGMLFSAFEPSEKSSSPPGTTEKNSVKKTGSRRAITEGREFFWKPRDLAPIAPIGTYQTTLSKEKTRTAQEGASKARKTETESGGGSSDSGSRPFYLKRLADSSVVIPPDEPVTAVSAPVSKTKAPVLKPVNKLRAVGPRTDARISQVNKQMGFIIVNAGSGDGLRENMVLNVYRRGRIIAKAVVRKVREDAAAALLAKEWLREDVIVGDSVSLY